VTQLNTRRRRDPEPGAVDNHERLVRLAYFVTVLLVLAVVSGFFPFAIVIFALIAMVMIHELGHFLTAKWAGMKVTEYFFGFGPKLWSIRKGETEYGIKALPLGGYVRIIGMNNLEQVDPADEPRTYRQQSFPKRLTVAVAGSFMHFVMAFVLLFVLWAAVGVPKPTLTVGELYGLKGGESPAQQAGFKVGDRILAVDGRVVHNWDHLPDYIRARVGKPIEFTVQRGNELVRLKAVPADSGDKSGFIGVVAAPSNERANPITALGRAGKDVGSLTTGTFGALGTLFSPGRLESYADQLNGHGAVSGKDADRPISVVGFVRVAGQAAQHGTADLLFLLALINIFVGIFNMVPLLPLDGGHVAVAVYERLRSRKGRRYQADVAKLLPLTAAVVMVLIVLGTATIYLDIVRPIANPFH
jgi:membrane-associated protease RseP (regulator of RpoE activity)